MAGKQGRDPRARRAGSPQWVSRAHVRQKRQVAILILSPPFITLPAGETLDDGHTDQRYTGEPCKGPRSARVGQSPDQKNPANCYFNTVSTFFKSAYEGEPLMSGTQDRDPPASRARGPKCECRALARQKSASCYFNTVSTFFKSAYEGEPLMSGTQDRDPPASRAKGPKCESRAVARQKTASCYFNTVSTFFKSAYKGEPLMSGSGSP